MAKKHKKDRVKPEPAPAVKDRFPGWLVWPVFAAWGIFVLKNYYSRFAPDLGRLFSILSPEQYTAGIFSVLPGHLFNILAAAVFLFCCFSAGRAALKAAGFRFAGALEETVFSCGAGFGLLAVYVFLLAAFGLLYFWPVAVFMVLALAAGTWSLLKEPLPPAGGGPVVFGPADFAALAVLLLAMLLNLAGTLSPEIFYDALVYHLAVPNYYAIRHGITPMPYNFYSNLPFSHGMLYSAALLLKGEILAKFINYGAGIFTAGAVLAIGARYFSLRTGLWAAAIFYTVGHAMFSAWSAGTEALLMFFSTLAVYAVLNRTDDESRSAQDGTGRDSSSPAPLPGADMRWLWLAACFCGLSMGVKYTGLFTAVGVMLAYAWSHRSKPLAVIKNLALFTLIAAVFVAPWLVKNYLYKGNPVYPFAPGLFGVDQYSDPQKLTNFIANASQLGPLKPLSWLLTPWKVTMGQVGNSEYFSPLFILLLPGAFLLSGPAGAALSGLWIFFLAVWGGWSVSSSMVRFLMPAYPAAGLIMAAYLFSPGHKALKIVLKAAALAVCFTGLYWAGLIFYSQGRWRPLTGALPAEEYLAHTQPTYPYSCYSGIKFINEKTGPDSKTLMIGDEKSFYFKKDYIVSSVYDKTAIVEYSAASKDGDDLYARLKADGVTHILLNTADAIRLGRDYRMFYWDERARGVFYTFWERHAREVFTFDDAQNGRAFNRIAVYELMDKLPAGAPPAFNVMKEVIMKNIDAK
ncbi:MAG: phospholipid carrier-dependent glycosyltransferase [Elusimicrobiota bacterium]|nr:phospholipid carrier-dependent glycosyltransferase [Elusimicrobiota bacterium]